jgi:hypothetical protein
MDNPLPPGTHTVSFELLLGLAGTVIGLLLSGVVGLFRFAASQSDRANAEKHAKTTIDIAKLKEDQSRQEVSITRQEGELNRIRDLHTRVADDVKAIKDTMVTQATLDITLRPMKDTLDSISDKLDKKP